MQPEMKQKVHAGHLSVNICLWWVRDLIFWPEILQYVEAYASTM